MKSTVEKLFFQGKYRELLDKFHDLEGARKPQALHYVVGALVFSGRGPEAISLFNQTESSDDRDQRWAGRFFLMIHYVRAGDVASAQDLRKSNELITPESALQRFFKTQSAAFYDYYLGKRLSCESLLKDALSSALEARFAWGRLLVIDMLGHIQFETGRIQEAIKNFHQCLELAERISNLNIAEALRITIALYRARVSVPGASIIAELEDVFRSTGVDDNYTRGNILLEIARLTTLVGRWQQAEEVLSRALTHIYQFANARQEVLLNLRWAYLEYCQGELSKSLNYITIAKAKAQSVKEESMILSVWGLERRVLSELSFTKEFMVAFANKHSDIESSHSSYFNDRIRARETVSDSNNRRGEDPLGDLLDELKSGEEATRKIIDFGLFGLLKSKRLIPVKKPSIVLDSESRVIVVSDRHAIERFSFHSKPKVFEFVLSLVEGVTDKSEIFSRIWGSKYVSHLHDSVLYTNIANLRKSLGGFAYFIETSDHGYRLNSSMNIEVVFISTPNEISHTKQIAPTPTRDRFAVERKSGLNTRQAKLLKSLAPGELIDTRTYGRLLKVSSATANRDLRVLAKLGLLIRSGRSRDIAYQLPK